VAVACSDLLLGINGLYLFSNRLVSRRKKSPPMAKLQPIIEHQMPQCADESEWRAIKPTKAIPRPTNDTIVGTMNSQARMVIRRCLSSSDFIKRVRPNVRREKAPGGRCATSSYDRTLCEIGTTYDATAPNVAHQPPRATGVQA